MKTHNAISFNHHALLAVLMMFMGVFVFAPAADAQSYLTQAACEASDAHNRCWDDSYPAVADKCRTFAGNVWTPNASSTPVCSGESLVQTSTCGTTRTLNGTTAPDYTPPTSSVCKSQSFTQTAKNCLNSSGVNPTRNATGTDNDPKGWYPPTSAYCTGEQFIQRSSCYDEVPQADKATHQRTETGTRDPEWDYQTDQFCTNEDFTQTSTNCSKGTNVFNQRNPKTQNATGTEEPVWTPAADEVCKGFKVSAGSENCWGSDGQPLQTEITGTKTESDPAKSNPKPDQYCTGEKFISYGECYDENINPGDYTQATGTATPQWGPEVDPAEVCVGETEEQVSSCLYDNPEGNDTPTNNNDDAPKYREVAGTNNAPACCVDETWNPPKENYCYNEKFKQTSNCGTEIEVFGSNRGGECCTTLYWTPNPSAVCDGVSYTPTDNCGNASPDQMEGTKTWGTDSYGNECGSADGECLPGLPCPKIMSSPPLSPFDGKLEANEDGDNAMKANTNMCDANYMNQLQARAFLEAERELKMFETVIRKPDSVLEYSCFDKFVNTTAYWSPNGPLGFGFSESKRWSATECEEDDICKKTMAEYSPAPADAKDLLDLTTVKLGYKRDGEERPARIEGEEYPPIKLGVYMADGLADGETRMGYNLKYLVMDTLNSYLNTSENFSHDFLGGGSIPTGGADLLNNSVDGEIDPTPEYVCLKMNLVWFAAKCENFERLVPPDDVVLDFVPMGSSVGDVQTFLTYDPRRYPQACENPSGYNQERLEYLQLAMNRLDPTGTTPIQRKFPYVYTDTAQYVSNLPGTKKYMDFLKPGGCEPPVATGLMVKRYTYDRSLMGRVETTIEEKKEDICVNPGCYYDWDEGKCVN